MTTPQQERQRIDPWAAPGTQGISVRATLVALVVAFLGIVLLGALLIGHRPPCRPAREPMPRHLASARAELAAVNEGGQRQETGGRG